MDVFSKLRSISTKIDKASEELDEAGKAYLLSILEQKVAAMKRQVAEE